MGSPNTPPCGTATSGAVFPRENRDDACVPRVVTTWSSGREARGGAVSIRTSSSQPRSGAAAPSAATRSARPSRASRRSTVRPANGVRSTVRRFHWSTQSMRASSCASGVIGTAYWSRADAEARLPSVNTTSSANAVASQNPSRSASVGSARPAGSTRSGNHTHVSRAPAATGRSATNGTSATAWSRPCRSTRYASAEENPTPFRAATAVVGPLLRTSARIGPAYEPGHGPSAATADHHPRERRDDAERLLAER